MERDSSIDHFAGRQEVVIKVLPARAVFLALVSAAMASVLVVAPTLAQSLRGRVLDDSTGTAIAGARVELLGQDGHVVQQVLTGQDGRFRLHVP